MINAIRVIYIIGLLGSIAWGFHRLLRDWKTWPGRIVATPLVLMLALLWPLLIPPGIIWVIIDWAVTAEHRATG